MSEKASDTLGRTLIKAEIATIIAEKMIALLGIPRRDKRSKWRAYMTLLLGDSLAS